MYDNTYSINSPFKPFKTMRPATDRLFQLLWSVQEDYKGILETEDISAIKDIIRHRINEIKAEEKSLATYHTIDEETYKSL